MSDISSASSMHKILFFGIMVLPFTSLRLSAFGVGELVILCVFAFVFLSNGCRILLLKPAKPLLLFWILFLAFSLCGFVYNVFLLGFSSGREYSFIFDGLSYLFVFMTTVLFGNSYLYSGHSPDIFLRRIFIGWGVVFAFLYALSFFFSSIAGLPLRYHDYFSPLVENVHQAASITCVMPFILLHILKDEQSFLLRVFLFFLAISFFFMAIGSGSTKALMGVVVGGGLSLMALLFYSPGGKRRPAIKFAIVVFVVFLVFIFLAANFSYFNRFLEGFFLENDGGGARAILYRSGFNHAMESFLVGYGPGSHAPYGPFFSDAHNTILTVMLQSGILGLVCLFILIVVLLYRSADNFFLLGALFSVLMYIIGGDVMRRLPIWILLLGISYFTFYSRSSSKGG